jgi:1,4-dihydroxy-2-naphthoate octaprenyltransferase
MTEEELNRKQIRFNRWALLIALLLVAGGFVLAILRNSDWWAFGGCSALALVLTIFGTDEKNPSKLRGGGVVMALVFFFLYMAVKFIISSV